MSKKLSAIAAIIAMAFMCGNAYATGSWSSGSSDSAMSGTGAIEPGTSSSSPDELGSSDFSSDDTSAMTRGYYGPETTDTPAGETSDTDDSDIVSSESDEVMDDTPIETDSSSVTTDTVQ